MVPIESRAEYFSRIQQNPKLSAFHNLLSNKTISIPSKDSLNEADEIYFGVVNAVQKNDKTLFEKYYNLRSKSNPSKESPSPFVNDDYLIYSLIIGIEKFALEKNWIKNIISIRNPNAVNNTLSSLLNENYYSKDNLLDIVLMFLNLTNAASVSNDILNNTFSQISENVVLFEGKNDFQILCTIHAYDFIILMKDSEGGNLKLLEDFNERFIKRTKMLSYILQMLLLGAFLYCLLELPLYSPKTVDLINQYGYVFTILGAIGFTFFSNQITYIKRKCHELTMQALGYSIALIKKHRTTTSLGD